MAQFTLYLGAILLFMLGLYGVLTHRNLLRIMLCLGLMESATFLLFITIGYRAGATAPIFYEEGLVPGTIPVVDPIVQALTLTSVVISMVTLAMVLALIIQLARHYRTLDARRIRELRG